MRALNCLWGGGGEGGLGGVEKENIIGDVMHMRHEHMFWIVTTVPTAQGVLGDAVSAGNTELVTDQPGGGAEVRTGPN